MAGSWGVKAKTYSANDVASLLLLLGFVAVNGPVIWILWTEIAPMAKDEPLQSGMPEESAVP
jgi:hypothetical protein